MFRLDSTKATVCVRCLSLEQLWEGNYMHMHMSCEQHYFYVHQA